MNDDGIIFAQFSVELREPAPISANALYSSDGTKRFLTAAGEKFKDALTMAVVQTTMPLGWKSYVDAVYKSGAWIRLEIELHLPKVLNGSWKVGGSMTKPRKRKDGSRPKPQPRSPYQRVDATNYVKIIEDAVVAGTGIDDSAHLKVSVSKYESPEDPRVVVHYYVHE